MTDGASLAAPAPPPLRSLEEGLGYTFRDRELLRRALVHTSYVNEAPDPKPESNERLEFLGDAAFELIVADRLYRGWPHLAEGDLTTMRASVVRLEALGRIGVELQLGCYLWLGRGEESTGGRQRHSLAGRALEAVIGAIYLDGGLEAAREVALRLLEPEIARVAESQALKDPKSRLQELSQGDLGLTPTYRMVAAVGPDHAKEFTVEVSLGDAVVGRGIGQTKQSASQAAATDALARWPPHEIKTRR